ncbi:putative methyltransferase [Actimicrobium sp. GrIS 1.19]|uniref:class I SAM-dependent methyltransferase n=1 Tax=Actimicrobium sp. GrIS 1.19 TaxID=3071708 RepID=UPI002E064DEE|nr:putative methyltransferase [Actimicrobium sp. GrIS 1.19]
MSFKKHLTTLALLASSLAAISPVTLAATDAATASAAIDAAVYDNNYWRTDAEKARDRARRPAEVLAFIGVTPAMTVAENFPGGGWYSHILGPLLKQKGTYFGAETAPEIFLETLPEERREAAIAKRNNWQATFGESQLQLAGPKARAFFYGRPAGQPGYQAGQSVDVIFDARNIHNLVTADNKKTDLIFAEYFRVLKSKGVLGIIDHRENENSDRAPEASARLGYVKESVMIAMAEKAGFKLVARSDLLANPNDTKDYADGVWTLPPVLTLKDKDRAKYVAIGESDRMLLKFIKP